MSDNIVLKRVFVTPDKAQEMLKKNASEAEDS